MKLLDQWIGETMVEMDTLGIAENTIVIVMGGSDHFTKYSPQSGYTPMIFLGSKDAMTEGGVRVDALVRWPGIIEADSNPNSIFNGRSNTQMKARPLGLLYDSIDNLRPGSQPAVQEFLFVV